MRLCYITTLTTILLTVFSFVPNFTQAQTPPCGTITAPANWQNYLDPEEPLETNPIIDCQNPFGVTDTGPSPDTLYIASNQVFDTNVIEIPTVTTSDYNVRYDYSNRFISHQAILFKHVAESYEYVSIEQLPPTEEDYRLLANQFFTDPNDIDDAVQRIMSNDPWAGLEYGSEAFTKIDNFDRFVRINLPTKLPPLNLGTYTLIFKLSELFPTWHESLLKKFTRFFVPVAYAASPGIYKITFTLKNPTPEPAGASSVLFLPGIQASRLYLGDGNQVFNRLWEPSGNIDVSALGLNEQGSSLVDIRTNDIIDETSVQYIGDNIYKNFISFMNNLVGDQVIAEWTPFAYDWRYDVFEIAKNGTKYLDGSMKNPTDEIIRLASSSLSKKVTIIAHSNGGLLAKALMLELKDRGRDDLVDKIVFIGTPQLGTPKAIATVLHGYDQEALGGLIIDDGVARNVIKNLPGAYSLLPSEKYQELVSIPLVRFDSSIPTSNSLFGYGSRIDSIGEFNAFMNGQEDMAGRANVSQSEVNKPTKVNGTMFFDAQLIHKQKLDNWVPPNATKVFQIVGTGLATIESIEYREITETVCPFNAISILLCPKVQILKPHAYFTAYGDETVVSKSAGYISGGSAEIAYLDLYNANSGIFNTDRSHEDLTESNQVQDFISNILRTSSSSNINFISNAEPVLIKTYDITEINSPVQLSVKDSQGRITGMLKENGILVRKEEIPDSSYIEFGTTKYLIVPSDIKSTTTLSGEAWGGYTMTLSTLDSGNNQVKKHEIVNATTTPNMKVTFSKSPSTGYGEVETDFNGDGVIDSKSTVDGVNITIVPAYSYPKLISSITALPIPKVPKDVLLALAKQAQVFHDKTTNRVLNSKLEKLTLLALHSTVTLYQRNKILTKIAADNLLIIINFLSK